MAKGKSSGYIVLEILAVVLAVAVVIGAIDAIWYYSKGVPRTINIICDAALVYGYGDNRESIDKELVIDVVKDKMKGGIPSLGLAQLPQGMDIK